MNHEQKKMNVVSLQIVQDKIQYEKRGCPFSERIAKAFQSIRYNFSQKIYVIIRSSMDSILCRICQYDTLADELKD